MKEGNNQKYKVDGGIGLIASRLTVQGPIKKDTSSFIVSARRTYIDVVTKPFIKSTSPTKGSGYYFYDLNTKINYRLSDKDRLFISGYFGRDVFTFKSTKSNFDIRIPWGNATLSARWNHLFSNKLFLNTSFVLAEALRQNANTNVIKELQFQISIKLLTPSPDPKRTTSDSWARASLRRRDRCRAASFSNHRDHQDNQ